MAMLHQIFQNIVVSSGNDKFPSLEKLMVDNGSHWEELESMTFDCKKDLVILLYSSGTTGKPKGVPHTHYEMMYQCFQRK